MDIVGVFLGICCLFDVFARFFLLIFGGFGYFLHILGVFSVFFWADLRCFEVFCTGFKCFWLFFT